MPEDGMVGICYQLPAELHHAAKTIAAARRISLRQFIIESLIAEVARDYDARRGAVAADR